ncbi:response regulator [Aestuariirhabdus litorea]|uniref:Response regulator n=1 Tax=Aestuariirhabdus litorea TaxID=2528527 RepID=A0A3P3VLT8_9GAMM|nr:response regulator [Aestuariirhabdus litorea]RRJ83297.1 response regulator [Aestuariirhabdus litorea]RWW93457.1 response regulator [Endozoicomonadaceae bacterium GTF-13]
MSRLLLVDDDRELCELLVEYLAIEGFEVEAVHDGESGAEAALQGGYSLVLLDVTLPKLNGFEVLKRIRKQSEIPVLMLTARGDDVDRIIGLEIGADDYLPKPYNHRELVARIKAILRRAEQFGESLAADDSHRLQLDDIELNLANHEVTCNGQPIELTATEFIVLRVLLERAGELISRAELTELALERRLVQYDRAIDMHVSNVRRKLGAKPDGSPRFKTVRGSGYYYIATGAGH